MVTKLNTYEGVPIGGNNFSDFMEYIRGFLGANFGFSTNALTNEGGFFEADNFVYDNRAGAGATQATFFTPTGKPEGNFFGRLGTEYFRFNVLTNDASEPQVYKWTTLVTANSSGNTQEIRFENSSVEERQLPYRPVFKNTLNEYAYGYSDVRLNGIIQDREDYALVYPYNGTGFSAQSITFNRLRLGAESPVPVKTGRYDGSFNDPQTSPVSRKYLRDEYDSTISFEHTNFSLDFGAHIILWRVVSGVSRFAYIPQDLSSNDDVAPGMFKVLDYTKGTIKLNISNFQLEALIFESETVASIDEDLYFTVISAEQLKEENVGGVQYYYTRYGKVYNGDSQEAILAEYVFDGNNNIVREIPQSEYFSGIGDLLLQDVNNRYTDGVVLGIQYYAIPDSERIALVQRNRYKPDTFQFYFHLGIVKPVGVSDADIRCMLEQNPSSWYNRDVLDSEYFPVNRTDETYFTFLTVTEAGSVGFANTFDPTQAFKIVDTIGLEDLNDIGIIGPNQVIIRNSSDTQFIGSAYTLAALFDTTINSPVNNHILRYSSGSWRNSTRPVALQDIEGNITYTTAVSNALGLSTAANVLITKGYVDSIAGTVGGDVAAHAAIGVGLNNGSVHGSTSAADAYKIIARDANGRASIGTPAGNLFSGGLAIVNVPWVRAQADYNAEPNMLALRNFAGRIKVGDAAWPDEAASLGQVEAVGTSLGSHSSIGVGTNNSLAHGATSALENHKIVARDSAGRANIENPAVTYTNGSGSVPGMFSLDTSLFKQIANPSWVLNTAARVGDTASSNMFHQAASSIPRRDTDGWLYARTPLTTAVNNSVAGRRDSTVATKGYVDSLNNIKYVGSFVVQFGSLTITSNSGWATGTTWPTSNQLLAAFVVPTGKIWFALEMSTAQNLNLFTPAAALHKLVFQRWSISIRASSVTSGGPVWSIFQAGTYTDLRGTATASIANFHTSSATLEPSIVARFALIEIDASNLLGGL